MHTSLPFATMQTFDAIINAGSGTVRKLGGPEAIAKLLQKHGREVRLRIAESGEELTQLAQQSAAGDADAVIAAGGDGTISGVAGAVIGSGKPLGVIPLGTFNFFSRRLGIPLELEAAAQNVFSGRPVPVNTGKVNERTFLNKASVGLYPLAARFREKMYGRYGRNKVVGILSGAFALLRRGHVMGLDLKTEKEALHLRTRFVFICLNPDELERLNIRGRNCLDHDQFAIYVPKPLTPVRMLGLAARFALRRVHDSPEYDAICGTELELDTRRPMLPVSLDGEVRMMSTPLRFAVHPRSLEVIVPDRIS